MAEIPMAERLAARAYRQGWAVGSDLLSRARGRKLGPPDEERHWRAGFDAGRKAAEAAAWAYEQKLKAERELLGEEVNHGQA